MELPIYQIDAFSSKVFKGNPAAVCPLTEWLPEEVLQSIAMENNLSETVFVVGGGGQYEIRWYTPTVEARLCGHATLAAAFVIFQFLEPGLSAVKFQSRRSGPLAVERQGEWLELDFPVYGRNEAGDASYVEEALGVRPLQFWEASNGTRVAVIESEDAVQALRPKLALIEASGKSLCVTSVGREADYVYRYFAPSQGIPEDPVTGSANCFLAPYWQEKLGRSEFRARQLSRRGGELRVRLAGDRVRIAGQAVLFLEGRIRI